MSLDRWIKATHRSGGGTTLGIPPIFYLDWEKREIQWLNEIPQSERLRKRELFTVEIKWKSYNLIITLCTPHTGEHIYQHQPEMTYTNISYLKSHLQKCIRRGRTCLALQTFAHLINLDTAHALRRLSIIILEDVCLIKALGPLIWLTAGVSKGYQLVESQVCWLFGLVYAITRHPVQDCLDNLLKEPFKLHRLPSGRFDESVRQLVIALQFRRSYGGLKGDLNLFDQGTITLIRRNEIQDLPIPLLTPPRCPLKLNNWILAGLDFHCISSMCEILMNQHDQFTDEQMRATIWHCSSSYNFRTYRIDGESSRDIVEKAECARRSLYLEFLPIWKIISRSCRNLAKYYLNRNY